MLIEHFLFKQANPDNLLYTWGSSFFGELGEGYDYVTPTAIDGLSWTAVSAGSGHTAAIRSDGYLFTWGFNQSGELGDDSVIGRGSPTQIGSSTWTSVSAGDNFYQSGGNWTAAIRSDNTLWVWGDNTHGQLGVNGASFSSPVQVGTSTWTAVSAGGYHTAAIRSDNTLWCWGLNNYGQLGDNSGIVANRSSPVQVGTSSSWTAVSAGQSHTAAIRSDYTLWAWGRNNYGQLGDLTKINRSSPVQVGSGIGAVSWTLVSAGRDYTLGLLNDQLRAWGSNAFGQLGDNSITNRSSPVQIGTILFPKSWTVISAGQLTSAAVQSDGSLWLWGYNTTGQIGDGTAVTRSSPVQIGSSFSWSIVSSGNGRTEAIRSGGTLFNWGSAAGGRSTAVVRSSPVQIGMFGWSSISVGGFHTLAIRSDGLLFAWGYNTFGQLGDGTAVSKPSPVQIGSSTWSSVSAGILHSAAIRSDGTLWTWGAGGGGQLGGGSFLRSSPVQIGTLNWLSVSAGGGHTAAIRSDGLLFTWGSNTAGELGNDDVIVSVRSSPVQIGSSTWLSVSAGGGSAGGGFVTAGHTAAIRSDDTLWTWGTNNSGQLGLNDLINRSSPVQVIFGTSTWTAVDAGWSHTVAISKNGWLWAWGENGSAQLGINSTIDKLSPALVSSLSWRSVGAGRYQSAAIRSDYKLFTWGANFTSFGALLGDNTTISRSSPVQIGSSSWTAVGIGKSHMAGLLL